MYTSLRALTISLLLFCIGGCGGGGSSISTAGGSSLPPSASPATITGVVAKGLFKSGTVQLYSIPASGELSKKNWIAKATINENGTYNAQVGRYTGVLLVEVTDGVYADEAQGKDIEIKDLNKPFLRALVSNVTGSMEVCVTPLTELAVQLAGATPTAQKIADANNLIAELFKVDSIISSHPVPLSAVNQATTAQKAYTFALAAFSQLASSSSLESVLQSYQAEIAANNNRLLPATVNAFSGALIAFLTSSRNTTGITTLSATGLSEVGHTTVTVRLNTKPVGVYAGDFISGVQLVMTLPAGVTIKADTDGNPLITPSGVAAPGTNIAYGINASEVTLAAANANGFSTGEFAAITCDVAPGSTPTTDSFPISVTTVTTRGGVDITGSVVVFVTF